MENKIQIETLSVLVITETLMQISEDGTRYLIDSDDQLIAYYDIGFLEEHLEMEWFKDVYDGVFDSDYDEWRYVAQTDFYDEDDEDDNYKGFERIFRTDDGKEVIYNVKVKPAILVYEENE